MENIVRIHGNKINLCIMRSDEEAINLYTKWINNESFNHFTGHNVHEITITDEERWAKKERDRFTHSFNIVEKATDNLIGTCELTEKHPHTRHCDIGIMIGDPDCRNKGYGTECIKMLCKYAFEELNAHSVEINVHSDNPAAIKCYKKAGFKKCGTLHESVYHGGKYCDLIIMEILKKDFS